MLLHGFTATPQEMRWLGEQLHAAGYTVHGVRIAGHATSVEELARTSWREWIASARDGLARVRQHADTVVVVGLSMGSLLALALAAEQPREVGALGLLSTALQLADPRPERYLPVLRVVTPWLPRRWQSLPKGGRDIADPVARAESPAYAAVPIRSLIDLVSLQRHARGVVPAIRQPVLAVHARHDHACPLDNVAFLERYLPAPPRVEVLERSFHVITVDYEKDRVAAWVTEFVATVAAQQEAESGTRKVGSVRL